MTSNARRDARRIERSPAEIDIMSDPRAGVSGLRRELPPPIGLKNSDAVRISHQFGNDRHVPYRAPT